jgi:hypothetical protein
MAKTAVGLFKNSSAAEAAVKALEAGGFSSDDIRVLSEPLDMPTSGALSTPRTDFEVALGRDLKAMGASDAHVAAYVAGVQSGGVIVFATAPGDKADSAVGIMNSNGAADVEDVTGEDVTLPSASQTVGASDRDTTVLTGRSPSPAGGAQLFVW